MSEEQILELINESAQVSNLGLVFWQVITSVCVTVATCVFLYFNIRTRVDHLEKILENGLTTKVEDLRERMIKLETTCHICRVDKGDPEK